MTEKKDLTCLEEELENLPGLKELIQDVFTEFVLREKITQQVAPLLLKMREDCHLTQVQMAEKLNVSVQDIVDMEGDGGALGRTSFYQIYMYAHHCGFTTVLKFVQPVGVTA